MPPEAIASITDLRNQIGAPKVSKSEQARPFLKWVGGKSQLLPVIQENLPLDLKVGEIGTYIEPFVGGGAVFFHIAQAHPLKRVILGDTNKDLVLAFLTIQKKPDALIDVLESIQTKYLKLSEKGRSEFYYRMRQAFNTPVPGISCTRYSAKWLERASLLMFLNKTCFNGLFRVNSSGHFNVAFGKYDNPTICDFENIQRVSRVLAGAEILYGDFQKVLSFVDDQTFLYLDPPYRPLTQTANFTSYSAATFTSLDQMRLANFAKDASSIGAKIMISNSDPGNVDTEDKYFEHMYPNFRSVSIKASRMINCKADKRGQISELLLMNY